MRDVKQSLLLGLLVCSVLTSACVPALVRNRPAEPNTAVPTHFPEQDNAAQKPKPAPNRLALVKWKEFFSSPSLRQLINDALKNNQELNINLQELVIAQAEVGARQGEYLPKVRIGGGSGFDKVSKYTSQGTSDEAHDLPTILGDFNFGLVGSWEVDVWGKLRNNAASANHHYLATVEGRNFMVTQLVAELANSYYDLLALDGKRDVLSQNIAIQRHAVEMVKIEKQAARVTELAVKRFEAEVAKNASVLFDLEQERTQVQNRINFLVGRFPQPVKRNLRDLDKPNTKFATAGLPTDLLRDRPDLKQAEYELRAANLDVEVARANFFPTFSIDASTAYKSFQFNTLLATPESLIGNLTGAFSVPWINRAALEAQYRSANARQIQAIIKYERAILQAFKDVSNQLAILKNLKSSYALRSEQVEKLSNSVAMSLDLFKAARADYVEVLLTRRDLLEAQLELIELRKELQQTTVRLYQALGGGWQS